MSDFGGKNVQNSISAGIHPDPIWGAYSAPPPDSWLHLRGPTSKRRVEKVNEGEKQCQKRSFDPQSLPQIDAPGSEEGMAAGHSGQFTPRGYLSTTLVGLEPTTFRLLVRHATSSATDSPVKLYSKVDGRTLYFLPFSPLPVRFPSSSPSP